MNIEDYSIISMSKYCGGRKNVPAYYFYYNNNDDDDDDDMISFQVTIQHVLHLDVTITAS